MEKPPYCTVSSSCRRSDVLRLALLTSAVLLVHGFHPWAEDGGLYAAGVENLLQPSLFPHDHPFVAAPMHYSLFAPAVAWLVRLSHLPLAAVLLLLYLFTTALLLSAALRLARRCFASQPSAQWAGVALLAGWWTMPVAGTSLLLMDPYLTARSFSTPLTLLALDQILQLRDSSQAKRKLLPGWNPGEGQGRHPYRPVFCCLALLLATAAFHPLMAIYAALFSLTLALVLRQASRWTFAVLAAACLAIVGLVQLSSRAEPPSVQLAVYSRYYWFLANWHWFEWLGLAGPLVVLYMVSQRPTYLSAPAAPSDTAALCRSGLFVGMLGMLVSALFVQEHFTGHTAARLQPLRCFLTIYALLPLLLGGMLGSVAAGHFWRKALSWTVILTSSGIMFAVQRATFPQSPHIEWPGQSNSNPWVQAFVWVREHTSPGALFALDALYINTSGEDAQSFRALAQRSTLPDFSKDGGEAANFPRLAPAWLTGATASADLSRLSDAEREVRLRGLPVTWLIMRNSAVTALVCPYRNGSVKVCQR